MNENALKTLCVKLQDLLQHELKRGNRVLMTETGWSKVKLAVRLAYPLDMDYVRQAAANNPDLEIRESHDVKNPREVGILCRSESQTLSGQITNGSQGPQPPSDKKSDEKSIG
jgi:hypothetical protein